jgi:acyl-CoA thioester hydrolase
MTHEPHRMEIRVRYAEVDRLGQVHSSRFPVYLEMGRTEMLRRTGLNYRDLERAGAYLVVSRLSLTFHQPARYDDVLTLETRISRATSARIDHAYRLLREDELLAEAETTLACVTADGRLQRLPDELLAELGVG